MNDVTIRIDGLWKRYGLPMPAVMRKGINWLHTIRNPWPRPGLQARQTVPRTSRQGGPQSAIRNTDDGPWALRDINLEMKPGETLGIIGRNGAGKSTLLKVLAGVIPPTRGRVEVRGRVFPMIELNAGLHTELTGRENVRLLGAIMGFSRDGIEAKIPEISEFCELGKRFDRPVRTYSSGMLARLGFSVAMNVEADILLIDEVLGVGDLAFRRKCYERFEQLRKVGVSTLFVSHSMRQVERICDQVILLENGGMVEKGDPDKVCLRYYQMDRQLPPLGQESNLPETGTWEGSGELVVEKVEILDKNGRRVHLLRTHDEMRIRVSYYAKEKISRPIIGVNVLTSDMLKLLAFGTGHSFRPDICLQDKGSFEAKVLSLNLMPGVYSVGVGVKSHDSRQIYRGRNLAEFFVEHSPINKTCSGIVHTDVEWTF